MPFVIQERSLNLESKFFKAIKIRTIKESNRFLDEEKLIRNFLDKHSLKLFIPPLFIFVRKAGLDELPQLLNVIRGQMSLIGPRPFIKQDLVKMKKYYPEFYEQRMKITSKPGISGLWQIYKNRENGFKELTEMDLTYQEKQSFLLDIKLIFTTAFFVLLAKNHDSITG
jgi:lipopolysaccharide/colanic/teichoic acid biosynthesis glycosyltransferase